MFSRVTRVTALVMSWVMFVTTTAPAQIPLIRGSRAPGYRGSVPAAPAASPSDSVSTVTPLVARGLDQPVDPDEYVIGPGDQFVLVVKSSGATYNLNVLPGGSVLLPNAGMVQAAGRTITEFREELKRVAVAYYRGGEFICELVVPRTFVVYVLGDVRRPGPVDISAPFRLDMIVTAAGGVIERGSLREIQVRDPDGSAKTYDLVRLQRLGDLKQNPMLHEGQNVFVPSRGASVEVAGEVWRGQTYELVPDETVMDLITLAGGFTTNADRGRLVVERITETNHVSILKLDETQAASTRVQDRDVIVVPDRRSFPGIDYVRVQGGGGRDGRIYLQEGETLASFRPRFIRLRNDFDLANSSIERRRDDGTVDFIKVDLKRLVEGDTTRTVVLKSGDVINIPPLQDVVFVAGEVVNPGGQEFQRGLPAGRYIAMAGGPTEVGAIDKLEIYDDHGNRRDANRDSVVYRGETVLVKRRTGVILGNLFLGFVSLTSLFLSVYAVIQQNN
jgi:protein involved in polysaccharide export with SLBB domain